MPEKIPYSSLERISRFLLLFCSVFFVLSVSLLARSCSGHRATEMLKARLVSQAELQTQLLRSQASDHSVYPHIDRNIGYVLNPYMKHSTWNAHPGGDGYRINSIGLRGEEIPPRDGDALRVLLLGDSVFFGWKLREEDTLASAMKHYLSRQSPEDDTEIVTAAIPGWNVLSQASFLENHFNSLRPDLIVWGLVRNDVRDVLGVIPPGQLAEWNSSQKASQAALGFNADFQKNLPMPAILERWDANISAIRTVRERYGLPVILLWVRAQERPFFELVMGRRQMEAPTVFVPGRFRNDTSSWCFSEADCHPNRWATRIIALGILDKLTRMGRIPALELDEEEQDVVRAFRQEEAMAPAPEQIESFLRRQLAEVPTRWASGDQRVRNSALYGLNVNTGRIMKNGVLFLRDPGLSSTLELDFKPIPNPRGYVRSAVFTLRNRDGEASRLAVDIAAERTTFEVPLPDPVPGAVYELRWQFDYAECTRPDHCRSGKLRGVNFGR